MFFCSTLTQAVFRWMFSSRQCKGHCLEYWKTIKTKLARLTYIVDIKNVFFANPSSSFMGFENGVVAERDVESINISLHVTITLISVSHVTFALWLSIILWKNTHGSSTLQVCQRGGWALFWVLPHLTMKEPPCHVCSKCMPLKQIIGQTITYCDF